jgi:hypothetical protein
MDHNFSLRMETGKMKLLKMLGGEYLMTTMINGVYVWI